MTLPTDPLAAPADPAPSVPVPADLLPVPVDPVADDHVADDAVQVEAAESELRRLGLEEIRVRHHGDLARLEAPHRDLATMTSEPLRGEVLRAVRSAGFRSVAVDLEAVPETGTGAGAGAAAEPGDA
ncbi:hypothetical protein [Promicromonospora sp. NPDC057488]|uniref:hypothetical protein n=1 Tax=Promicromonospora sp. NPDC057488 TaxID=3346147 RepID=UPI003673196E